jgi:hypothetical protein
VRTIELPYSDVDPAPTLSRFCAAESLRLSQRMTAAAGKSHWHIYHLCQTGTLELTWWPAKKRLWLKVASNRDGAWIDETIARLSTALQPRDP